MQRDYTKRQNSLKKEIGELNESNMDTFIEYSLKNAIATQLEINLGGKENG